MTLEDGRDSFDLWPLVGADRNARLSVNLGAGASGFSYRDAQMEEALKARKEAMAAKKARLREAQELHKQNRPDAAAWRFLSLAEAGHEVAQMNAAQLFDSGQSSLLVNSSQPVAVQALEDQRFLGRAFAQRHYELSAEQGNAFSERGCGLWLELRLGDYAYYGWGLRYSDQAEEFESNDTWQLSAQEADLDLSLAHYRRTATMRISGEWMQPFVARASFNLGYMYQFGVGVEQDLPLAQRFYGQSAEADPGAVQTPLAIMMGVLALQHFLAELPELEACVATVSADVRFHILLAHICAILILVVIDLLRKLHQELHGGLRHHHLSEVLIGLGVAEKAAVKVVELFVEATATENGPDLPVRFMDWLCAGQTDAARADADCADAPLKDACVDSDELHQIQAMQGRGVSNASQDSCSLGSDCPSTFSDFKKPGNPKLYTRRPSMMNQPKPSLKGAGRRLSVEISEQLLAGLDEDTSTWTGKEQKASSSSTVIVFDWDDTLLPTTAVVNEELTPDKSVLETHAEHVRETLRLAASLGRVAIVTLAARPWLQVSAKRYMPSVDWENLFHELNIPIVYSREVLDKRRMMAASQEPGVDLYVLCKRKAMSQAIKKLTDKPPELLFVSIGDSYVEAEAAVDLVWCRDVGCHRVIKLKDEPSTVEDLSTQLLELQELLPRVVHNLEGDKRFELANASEVFEKAADILLRRYWANVPFVWHLLREFGASSALFGDRRRESNVFFGLFLSQRQFTPWMRDRFSEPMRSIPVFWGLRRFDAEALQWCLYGIKELGGVQRMMN
eukprot:s376_g24.t3